LGVRDDSDRGFRFLLSLAALLIIVQGINQAQSALVSLLIAVFFAILGIPPVLWLERKRIPTIVAVLLVMFALFATLVVVGVGVGTAVNRFVAELPSYQTRLQEQVATFSHWLSGKGIHGVDKILIGIANPGTLMGLTANLLARLGSALSDIVLILLTVALILCEASSFPVKLRSVLGDPTQVFPQFTRFVGEMERYVVIHTLFSLATGLLVAIWLSFLDIDYAVLWGFLAFFLNYVPNVGSMIAAAPPGLVALVQFGPSSALVTLAGYLVINFTLGYVIENRVMGQKLGLSTLVVFLSLFFWANLLGPVGMVLSIPLTMTLKFACENNPSTTWIAILLGPEVPFSEDTEGERRPNTDFLG
jgi:AI-2 transport protein TqsA